LMGIFIYDNAAIYLNLAHLQSNIPVHPP
jgi:hypothetical protein